MSNRTMPAWDAARGQSPSADGPLQITVVAGVGEGRTPLSAFDAGLWQCGTHDYNLIRLSSVVPPGASVMVSDRYHAPAAEHGHRLYVVAADVRSDEPGMVLAAGLGWLQGEDGRGVFVEHVANALDESCGAVAAALGEQIAASLCDLALRRGIVYDEAEVGQRIAVTRVARQPACALALAVYQSEGWR